jgi:hypothetical protein
MTNYTKILNYTAKDALTVGDPLKRVRGSEQDAELLAIQNMSVTKANKLPIGTAGNIITRAADGDLVDSGNLLPPGNIVTENATQTLSSKTLNSPNLITATMDLAALTSPSALPIALGGTGQTTAALGFNALKQAATEADTGVVELADFAESNDAANTSTVITPQRLHGASLLEAFAGAAVKHNDLDEAILAGSGITITNDAPSSRLTISASVPTPTTFSVDVAETVIPVASNTLVEPGIFLAGPDHATESDVRVEVFYDGAWRDHYSEIPFQNQFPAMRVLIVSDGTNMRYRRISSNGGVRQKRLFSFG